MKVVKTAKDLSTTLVNIAKIAILVVAFIFVLKALGIFDKSDPNPDRISNITADIRSVRKWVGLTFTDEECVILPIQYEIDAYYDAETGNYYEPGIIFHRANSTYVVDDSIVKIFHGKINLGCDFSKVKRPIITNENGIVYVNLPKIQILDDKIIDESKSRTFYVPNRNLDFTKVIGEMDEIAVDMMIDRCIEMNLVEKAEDLIIEQFYTMLSGVDVKDVIITFNEE